MGPYILTCLLTYYALLCVAACLPVLHTLQITHNRLQSAADIEHLVDCPSIGVLDLSHNQLDDPSILDVFKRMASLVHRCIRLLLMLFSGLIV